MNTKKIFFAFLACATLMMASCTSSTAEDDQLYDNQSIERGKVKMPSNG